MRHDIVWEWLDRPGLEHLVLAIGPDEIAAAGVVVVELDGVATRLRYDVRCDGGWSVRSAALTIERGGERRALDLRREADGTWRVDGARRADLDGCSEIDIQGTPFTNTLPIRRLGLPADAPQLLRVAYVIVPALTVEPGEQEYTRLDPAEPPRRFRYRNPGNGFIAELAVDADEIVVDYPPYWRRRAP